MHRYIFCLCIVWISVRGAAEPQMTAENRYFQLLARARKASDIERIKIEHDHLRILRLACGLQMHSKQAPLSCYELLNLESRWNLYSSSRATLLRHRLDARCESAAQALRLPTTAVSSNSLSKDCRQAINEAQKMKAYRRGDDWSDF